ncbi:putative transferase [Medicago truncatula]|uniref:Adenylate isopentenyltransferase n=1 Tax=Medicago truncatula TaxID=3880 RepID=G7ID98_MEDTR|nr:adenylate isopentenyltransferase [Medicago truncatula]AES62904.2 adenylate isopentenyltransferase [Medicago truncatula]RHN82420.1 putative transferase [Medicago truncatula]
MPTTTTTPSFLSPPHSQRHYHKPIQFHHYSHTLFTPSSSSATHTRRRPHCPRMEISPSRHRRKDKVLIIVGATGSGKSRLSVELATLFPYSEIINSDKIQVYRGLDITTNKIPFHQRNNVPHHLLGDIDPSHGEFSPSDFRRHAGDIISDITSRRKLPIIVGGSNSFIHALLVERFDPESNVFDESSSLSTSISSDLRYKCCFLWMDISFPVLSEYLLKRVDDMFDSGMVNELAEFYEPDADNQTGLRKAIGVPEFDRFFKQYPPQVGPDESERHNPMREGAYIEAVKAIKDNTCQLAKRQIGKILRLKRAGWDLQRIDATEAFRAVLTSESNGGGEEFTGVWKKQVLEPSVKIVKRFLME